MWSYGCINRFPFAVDQPNRAKLALNYLFLDQVRHICMSRCCFNNPQCKNPSNSYDLLSDIFSPKMLFASLNVTARHQDAVSLPEIMIDQTVKCSYIIFLMQHAVLRPFL